MMNLFFNKYYVFYNFPILIAHYDNTPASKAKSYVALSVKRTVQLSTFIENFYKSAFSFAYYGFY